MRHWRRHRTGCGWRRRVRDGRRRGTGRCRRRRRCRMRYRRRWRRTHWCGRGRRRCGSHNWRRRRLRVGDRRWRLRRRRTLRPGLRWWRCRRRRARRGRRLRCRAWRLRRGGRRWRVRRRSGSRRRRGRPGGGTCGGWRCRRRPRPLLAVRRSRRTGRRCGRGCRTLRGAWRAIAETAILAFTQRLRRLRRRCVGLDHHVGFLHRHLHGGATAAAAIGTQVLRPDADGSGDALGTRQDVRPHLKRLHRPARHRRDEGRRNARIDRGTPTFAERNGAVDDAAVAENRRPSLRRHNVCAPARRGQIARRDEHPDRRLGFVLDLDVIRRQGRPADIVVAVTPVDPSRRPFVAGNPEPAALVVHPAAVVIGDPAPIRLGIVGVPEPAPFLGVNPMTGLVRAPIALPAARHPHLSPAPVAAPRSIRRKRLLEFHRNLRLRRGKRADRDRHRPRSDRKSSTRQEPEGQTAKQSPVDHFEVPSTSTANRRQRQEFHCRYGQYRAAILNGSQIVPHNAAVIDGRQNASTPASPPSVPKAKICPVASQPIALTAEGPCGLAMIRAPSSMRTNITLPSA